MKNSKKIKVLVVVIMAMSLMFQSCDKVLDPPDESTSDKVDRMKWNFEFDTPSYHSLINPVPAIDEEGNIYAIADVQAVPGGTQILKLSADGAKLWSKTINKSVASRPIYQDGKLYFLLENELFCFDASNGEKVWSVENAATFTIIALNSQKIYVTRFVDDGFLGSNYLEAYDLDGNKVWSEHIKYSETDTIAFPYTMSIRENQIYLGVLAEIGESNFAILNYQDNGDAVEKTWSWLGPVDYTTGNNYFFRDFAIDDNSNLLFAMEDKGVQYVFSVSSEGLLNWSSPTSLDKTIVNVAVDGDGDAFVSYDKCEKISAGASVWTSDSKTDWTYEGLAAQSPVISKNGNLVYNNFSSIVASVTPAGDYEWEQYIYPCDICTEEFHNLTMNTNGEIIVVSKFRVYCFTGDGSALAEKGWPKVYGNYGNTASK